MPCVIDRKSIVCDGKGVVFDSWLTGDGVGGWESVSLVPVCKISYEGGESKNLERRS